jgi:hypothetical protein
MSKGRTDVTVLYVQVTVRRDVGYLYEDLTLSGS